MAALNGASTQTLAGATQLLNKLGRTPMVNMIQHRISFLILCLVLALAQMASAQQPSLVSGDSVSPPIYGVLATPASPGPHPGVVILHGSAGWRPAYAQYAKALADSGFISLAIDYYSETGRDTVLGQALHMWPHWQAAVRRAVRWLDEQPSVSNGHIGLVGFSRGAFLAVSVGSSIPSAKAVVDFYGGVTTRTASVEEQVRNFPPLLILHGEADTIVPPRFAYDLKQAVISHGGEVEMHIYPGAHHAFNGTFSPTYSEMAAVDSFRRTVEFLKSRLKNK